MSTPVLPFTAKKPGPTRTVQATHGNDCYDACEDIAARLEAMPAEYAYSALRVLTTFIDAYELKVTASMKGSA